MVKKLLLALVLSAAASVAMFAQGAPIRLQYEVTNDVLSSNGDSITLSARDMAFGSVKIQTLDSYSGTWEVQCSVDGTTFDADSELSMTKVDAASTVVTSVTDTVGVWDVTNAAGCRKIKVVATAGFAASDTTMYIEATQTGGGGSGGGSGGGGEVTNAGTFAVQVDGAALTALQLIDNAVSGAGFNITQMNGVNVSMGSGVNGTGVQRISLATDDATAVNIADSETLLSSIDTSLSNIEDGLGQDCAEAAASSLCPSGPIQVLKFDDTTPTSVSEDQTVRARGSATGEAYAVLRDAAGNNRGANVNASNQLSITGPVTNAGTFAVQVDGAALTALQLIDNMTTDPCTSTAKTYIPIDIVTATTTELTASLAGASTHYYICSLTLVTAGANNVAIVDDDSDNCGSVTSGVLGGTTAGEGFNFAANGGLALGNGFSSVARTVGTNRVLCAVTSAAVQLSGGITVVAAP